MNFKQLEYLIALAEYGNFSEAAHGCNVSQATLSIMIKKLEDECGFQLINRSKKPLEFTELGMKVLEKAKKILIIQGELSIIDQKVPSELIGNITLGVIPTIATTLMTKVVPVLCDENPQLQLNIVELTTNQLIEHLRRGKIDLGMAATPLNDPEIDEEILYYEPMLVYGSSQKGRQTISQKELNNHKVWLLNDGHCFRHQVATLCNLGKMGKNQPNLTFEGSSFQTLIGMVNTMGGITFIPELYALDMGSRERDNLVSFKDPIPVREVSLLSYLPRGKMMSVDIIAQTIKRLINPHLSTSTKSSKDLRIMGINNL